METKSGAFVQKTLIRPFLDFEAVTPRTCSEHTSHGTYFLTLLSINSFTVFLCYAMSGDITTLSFYITTFSLFRLFGSAVSFLQCCNHFTSVDHHERFGTGKQCFIDTELVRCITLHVCAIERPVSAVTFYSVAEQPTFPRAGSTHSQLSWSLFHMT